MQENANIFINIEDGSLISVFLQWQILVVAPIWAITRIATTLEIIISPLSAMIFQ